MIRMRRLDVELADPAALKGRWQPQLSLVASAYAWSQPTGAPVNWKLSGGPNLAAT